MKKETIIDIFKTTNALLEGHFVLTSGRHSSTYFQCAKVLQYPEYLTSFGSLIAKKFIDQNPDLVISPAIGGIILGSEVGRQLGLRTIFSERKEEEMVLRRGFEIEPGEKVLIVEDVITTGGSVKEVMKIVENAGGNIIGVGVLVDRSNGAISLHNNQYAVASLEVISFEEAKLPEELSLLPIQKPGSRFS
ncbi:MAG: orotate phosphoribosyltransferase [Candidatus Marinimicrobia bacterium]|nr:orotate phosphoribosyltransferase [Candidatus Neomarinimicrobiota bacterium]